MWTTIPADREVPSSGNCRGGSWPGGDDPPVTRYEARWHGRIVTAERDMTIRWDDREGQRRAGVTFRPCRWPARVGGLEAVLVAQGVGLGAAGVGLVRVAGGGGLGPEAFVAAPGAVVRGVVVMVGVRAAHAAADAAPGAGPAGAGVRWRLGGALACTVASTRVLLTLTAHTLPIRLALLAGTLAGVIGVGLFLAAFAGAVGAGATRAGAEAALRPGSSGWANGVPQCCSHTRSRWGL